jgi:hypothetical protein
MSALSSATIIHRGAFVIDPFDNQWFIATAK